MKIAYTGWTWLVNHEDNYRWEFEQFLKEVADLGYDSCLLYTSDAADE